MHSGSVIMIALLSTPTGFEFRFESVSIGTRKSPLAIKQAERPRLPGGTRAWHSQKRWTEAKAIAQVNYITNCAREQRLRLQNVCKCGAVHGFQNELCCLITEFIEMYRWWSTRMNAFPYTFEM